MNFEIKITDIAIVTATIVGPILAVQAQKAVERWRADRLRRDGIFKTLMATRAARLAPNHIEALNMISIEFPLSNKRFKKVRSAWKAYLTHLGETVPDEKGQPVFFSKREDLFTDLLYEMGTALGYEFDKTEISKEVYSTVFHGKVEADLNLIREKLVEVLTGKAALPMAVVQIPNDPELTANQAEYMKTMVGYLRDGKALPITIVGGDFGKVVQMRQVDPSSDTKTG